MTNISNLNLSKGSIPPLLKYKIVFLGDQAVGKSSIINRFIYDIFDGNEHVTIFLLTRDPRSVLILFPKTSSSKIRRFGCNCGIQLASKGSVPLYQIIFETLQLLLLFMTLRVGHHLIVCKNGLMTWSINAVKDVSWQCWEIRMIFNNKGWFRKTRQNCWQEITMWCLNKSVPKVDKISNSFSRR